MDRWIATGLGLALAWLALPVLAQSWQFQKNRDPLGEGYVALANAKLQGVTPMVRCWTEQAALDVRFTFSSDIGFLSSDEVSVRFDGKSPQVLKWPRNATRLAMVVPVDSQRQILASLRAANIMQLRFAIDGGGEQTLQIPLDGSARAIGQVVAGCS